MIYFKQGDFVKVKPVFSLDGLGPRQIFCVKKVLVGHFYGARDGLVLEEYDPKTKEKHPVSYNGVDRIISADVFETVFVDTGEYYRNYYKEEPIMAVEAGDMNKLTKFQFMVEVPVPKKEIVTGYLDWVVFDTYNETVIGAFTNESQAKRFIEMCAADHYVLRKVVS